MNKETRTYYNTWLKEIKDQGLTLSETALDFLSFCLLTPFKC